MGLADLRRRAGGLVLKSLFEGGARLGNLLPGARPSRHGVEVLRNHRYFDGTAREHVLDVYRPIDARRRPGPPWPIVFYVHGGAFQILSKETHRMMALLFARRGFVVFNVDYRLAPRHRYPAAIEDVCRAFVWVTKNAARFGGDASRLVLAGESAGANLVTSLAVALAYEREEPFARAVFETGISPRAVVPACGVFQVTDIDRLRRRKPGMAPFVVDRLVQTERGYLGRGPHACSLDLADPLVVLERGEAPARPLAPFFLPVGTRDPLLPDTRRMAEALRKLGVDARDRYYEGELHAFHALPMRDAARQCWRETFAFLDEHS